MKKVLFTLLLGSLITTNTCLEASSEKEFDNVQIDSFKGKGRAKEQDYQDRKTAKITIKRIEIFIDDKHSGYISSVSTTSSTDKNSDKWRFIHLAFVQDKENNIHRYRLKFSTSEQAQKFHAFVEKNVQKVKEAKRAFRDGAKKRKETIDERKKYKAITKKERKKIRKKAEAKLKKKKGYKPIAPGDLAEKKKKELEEENKKKLEKIKKAAAAGAVIVIGGVVVKYYLNKTKGNVKEKKEKIVKKEAKKKKGSSQKKSKSSKEKS